MLHRVKDALYRAITSPRGDSFGLVRFPKDMARRSNIAFGSPLASTEELQKRSDARAPRDSSGFEGRSREAHVRAGSGDGVLREDRNSRELERVQEVLGAKKIVYTTLDVTGDEATLDFVMREAKCEKDELPVVFVAGTAFGGFRALVEADVSGALEKAIFGE